MSCQLLHDSYFLCAQSHGPRLLIRANPACIFSWGNILQSRKEILRPHHQGFTKRFQGRHVPQDMEEFISRALVKCNPDHLKTSLVTCMSRATNFGRTPRRKKQRWPYSQKYFHHQHTVTFFLVAQVGGCAVNKPSSHSTWGGPLQAQWRQGNRKDLIREAVAAQTIISGANSTMPSPFSPC